MTDVVALGQRRLGARQLGHVGTLDGIRGIAVLMVISEHFRLLSAPWIRRSAIYDRITGGGFLGVEVFFVLSGFLITTLLLREWAMTSRIHLGRFYGRRALRLLPALFVMLFIFTLVSLNEQTNHVLAWPDGHPAYSLSNMWPTLQSALFYYLNWFFAFTTGSRINELGHLWSLSIEEQFYFAWPLLLLVLLACVRRDALRATFIAAGFVLLVLHRYDLATNPSYGGLNLLKLYSQTDTRIDGLVIGCLVAVLYQKGWIRPPVRRALAVVGLAMVAVITVTCKWTEVSTYKYGFTVFNLGMGMLMLQCVEGDGWLARALSSRPLRSVGKISYGLYLWNFPIVCYLVRHTAEWRVPYRLAVASVIIPVIALASWYLIERPALRLKDRWFAADSRPVDGGDAIVVPSR